MKSSQFAGGYKLGDLRPLVAAAVPRYFVEDGQEWLASGSLKANTGNAYAELLAKFQNGYGVHAVSDTDALYSGAGPSGGSSPSSSVGAVYWTGTRYVALPNMVSSGSQSFYHGATLAGISTLGSVAASSGLSGHTYLTSSNSVVLSTRANAPECLQRIDNTGGISVTGGGPSSPVIGVAGNGVNLAVAIREGVSSNLTNGIYTSTDGSVWTGRTGSLGSLITMHGIHYAAHLGRFLTWGVAGGQYGILSSPDGFTFSVSRAPAGDFTLGNTGANGGGQAFAASSPTATLIAATRNSDGAVGFLRTTDGTTWTFVSPFSETSRQGSLSGTTSPTVMPVQYDAVRGRFVALMQTATANGTRTDNALYAHSTDGITWSWSGALGHLAKALVFFGFSNPNGQDLAILSTNSNGVMNGTTLQLVPGSKVSGVPSHVGAVSPLTSTGATPSYSTGLPTPTYFLRIK